MQLIKFQKHKSVKSEINLKSETLNNLVLSFDCNTNQSSQKRERERDTIEREREKRDENALYKKKE